MPKAYILMQNAPQGDCRRIPDPITPYLMGIPLKERVVIALVVFAATERGRWMGFSLIQFGIRSAAAPRVSAEYSWPEWCHLYGDRDIIQNFRETERSGWITISDDGYAYPTQKLADLLCTPE